MEFTFHNSNVILELLPSTFIVWTDPGCWRKRYSSTATMLLGCIQRYKNYTVVMTTWLTVIFQMKMDLLLFTQIFSIYHCHDFYRARLYIWATRRVSYKKQKLLILRNHQHQKTNNHLTSETIYWRQMDHDIWHMISSF